MYSPGYSNGVMRKKPNEPERDDLTFSEKVVNLFMFSILFIALICFIVQLGYTFKSHRRKDYIRMHFFIIFLLLVSVISR